MAAHVVLMDKSKPKPDWLQNRDREKTIWYRYYNMIWNAQPIWADREAIRATYKAAAKRREQGDDVEVDHIVPLRNPLVCGLHVPYNLRVITKAHNAARSNNVWPDMPFEQTDLFSNSHASAEFELCNT